MDEEMDQNPQQQNPQGGAITLRQIKSEIRTNPIYRQVYPLWRRFNKNAPEKLLFKDINKQNRDLYTKFYTQSLIMKNREAHIKNATNFAQKRLEVNETTDSAFHNRYTENVYNFYPPVDIDNYPMLQETVKNLRVKELFTNVVRKRVSRSSVKFYLSITFDIIDEKHLFEELERTFAVDAMYIDNAQQFKAMFDTQLRRLYDMADNIYKVSIKSIQNIKLIMTNVHPLPGGTYKKLPDTFKNRGVVNIKNEDTYCFLYSVGACIRPISREVSKNRDRVSHYKWVHKELKYDPKYFKGVGLDVHSQYIQHFEKQNEICVNIYTSNSKVGEVLNVRPLRVSQQKYEKTAQLLYYDGHYCAISNFSMFCGTENRVCPRCFKNFQGHHQQAKNNYEQHLRDCRDMSIKQKVKMPTCDETTGEKPTLQFKSYRKQSRAPIVIYSDFESINAVCENTSGRKTEHKPVSYRMRIQSDIPLDIPIHYDFVGMDAHKVFVKTLMEIQPKLHQCIKFAKEKYTDPKNMIITPQQKMEHDKCDICRFCNKEITQPDDGSTLGTLFCKVRDHCHFTGRYRGAAHASCNLLGQQPRKTEIPIVFHNMNYDLRMILNAFTELGGDTVKNDKDISVIASNSENYKSIKLGSYRFVDSMAFQMASLEALIDAVPPEKKRALREISGDDEKLFQLICSKGEFPYQWCDSYEKLLNQNIKIPKWHQFKNDLTKTNMSYTQYLKMLHTCRSFGITNFREFHDLYLKRDVFGLCDVFELFREVSMDAYGLDPAHYIGTPSLAWDAMLKYTEATPELLTDEDMYMFFERGTRGGMSQAVTRHVKANNPYLSDYKKGEKHTYLMYWDANNLYAIAMMLNLPYKDFCWYVTNIDEVIRLCQDYNCKSTESQYGYTFEVDLEYPEAIHDKTNQNPLAPVHKNIQETELSPYAKDILNKTNTKFAKDNKKLCGTVENRTRYVVHIGALKFYLEQGMKLTAVHRCVKYTEKQWLKPYIDYNTEKRSKCTRDYEKDYYKLMNNAVFGKTMEDVRDRNTFKFITDAKKYEKYTTKPEFKFQIAGIGDENFRILSLSTSSVELNKPIYTGQAILDCSKIHMYDFYYNTLYKRYGDKMKLVMTDTDSFLLSIETNDIYDDIYEMKERFDTHNYPQDHKVFTNERKKQVGFFKDELCDGSLVVMSEVVALRSKVYAYIDSNGCEKKTLKGINKSTKNRQIQFAHYSDCLFKHETLNVNQTSIRSFQCINYTIEQNKKALTPYDDKRYILPHGVDTLPYGHYKIHQ
jgi:hypothetical protein